MALPSPSAVICVAHCISRAMLCKRGLCRHAVSVCLFVTFVNSVETNKHIFKFFPSSGSHIILVYQHQTLRQHFDGDPLCRYGMKKKSRFSTNISLHRVLSTVRPSSVVNRVPPDRGMLVTLIASSLKRRRLLITGDGGRTPRISKSCYDRKPRHVRRRQLNEI